jgi:predicted transcriptional regulator
MRGYTCIKLSPELKRHLTKYAMMKKTTTARVVIEAIEEYTRYNECNLAVKWVPKSSDLLARQVEELIHNP